MLLSRVEIDHISLCILIAIHYTTFSVKGECSDWSNVDALFSFSFASAAAQPCAHHP